EHDAAAGRLEAPERAANLDGLAGYHTQHRVAVVHGISVHDPGHDLWVRVHVGRRDVAMGRHEDRNLGGVAARQPFEFTQRQLLGVYDHAALGAAIRQARDG